MAKQKKEKQIPVKQQMYEQIITKQLYGDRPTREEGIAKLQADYDTWKARQDGIAKLQADYDAWQKAQQPQQPVETQPVETPVVNTPKVVKNKPQKESAIEVKAPEEKKTYLTHADIIPTLTKVNVDKQRQKLEKQEKKKVNEEESIKKIAAHLNISEAEVKARIQEPKNEAFVSPDSVNLVSKEEAQHQSDVEKMNKFLDPSKKLTDQEKREAKEIARRILDVKGNPNISGEYDKERTDAVNLMNKTNAFTNFMQGVINPYYRIAKPIDKKIAGAEDKAREGVASVLDNIGITENGKEEALREIAERRTERDEKNASMENAYKNAQIQNPLGATAGNLAGMLSQYYLTNPIFDAAAGALGITGRAGKFLVNQLGQNAQDVALDTLPHYAEYMEDGVLSDEEKKQLKKDAGWNAIGNLIPGLVSEGVTSYKGAKAAANAAADSNAAFRENALEGYEKLKALNAEDAAKQIEVPKVPEIEAPKIEVPEIEAPKVPSQASLPQETFDKIDSYFEELARPMNEVQNSGLMETVTDEKALKEWDNLNAAYSDYLNKSMFSDNVEEITAAKKTLDNTRKRYARAMKDIDPEVSAAFNSGSYGYRIGRPLNARNTMTPTEEQADEAFELIRELEESNKPQNKVIAAEMEGAKAPDKYTIEEEFPPGQGFVEDGKSRVLTNSAVNANIIDVDTLKNDPVLQEIAKYDKHKNSDIFNQAMKRIEKEGSSWMDDIISGKKSIADDVDVDSAMITLQDLATKIDEADEASKIALTAQRNSMLSKLREYGTRSGQGIQAFAKWNNTADGALLAAGKLQEDEVVKPWLSKNVQAKERNSRIAKALADMGNNTKAKKEVVPLTHEQIKAGVRAELEKEFGSIEQYFNDNDLEYLTMLAEDKSIPVWKITDEIEHKLNHGSWYTLDEGIEPKMPTNKKLQNALNSLIDGNVRAEKTEPTLAEIANEVRNTLNKESASLGADFTDDDVNYIAGLIKGKATTNEIASALNTKLATGNFGVSFETQQKVSDLFKYIENKNPNSREFVEAQAEAFRLLAEEIAPKATFLEKFDTWRYMAMLGNPKTMLRNFIGNKMFGALTSFSNGVAALGEEAADKAVKAFGGNGIQRTKAILNPITDSKLLNASAEDVENSVFRQLQGAKYEKMDKDFLRISRSTWNSKTMRKAEELIDKGISDYGALKSKYTSSLAGYLKANGYDDSVFDAADRFAKLQRESKTRLLTAAEQADMDSLSKVASDLDKAREYAIKQAEYATFHEDNVVADLLSRASRTARSSDSAVGKAMGYAIEGTIPFKKTPANILRSGVDYSPLGAIDSIKKTGKLIYENTGKRAGNLADTYMKKALNGTMKEVKKTLAADVIESWSKTLTGSGLMALGYYLANKGILHVSDDDTKYQDQLEGIQNYSLKINGKTYTVDWAVPSFMPLALGAELNKVIHANAGSDEDAYKHIDDYLDLANRLAQPMVETSMLQGVKDTLETAANTAKYNDTVSVPATAAWNMLTGYATQAIPTLSGQIARTVDDTRRSTYSGKESPTERALEKQLRKTENKVPFLSMINEPYVDTYGREQKNSPFNNKLANFAYQTLSPGYLSDVNTTDADKLSREMYNLDKETSMLPEYQTSFKIDGKRVSPEDYTKGMRAAGEAQYEIRDALANDEWFNGLSNDEKKEIVKGINTTIEHVGKAAIDPEYSNNSKSFNAYKDGGIPSLLDYYKEQHAKDLAKESGLDSRTKASEEIQQEILNGNTEAAQQTISEAASIIDSGLNAHGYDVYKARKSNIEDKDKWIAEYKKIDSLGNSDGFVNQEEFISAIKKNNWSENEAVKYSKLYGNWKYIPYLKKDGTWGFHKAK